jgi:hypothetical protein
LWQVKRLKAVTVNVSRYSLAGAKKCVIKKRTAAPKVGGNGVFDLL